MIKDNIGAKLLSDILSCLMFSPDNPLPFLAKILSPPVGALNYIFFQSHLYLHSHEIFLLMFLIDFIPFIILNTLKFTSSILCGSQ